MKRHTFPSTSGFALPIVIILAAIASSLLAYDLQRLEGRAKLIELQLLKGRVELLMQSQVTAVVDNMNIAFSQGGCANSAMDQVNEFCQFDSFVESSHLQFEGMPLVLTLVLTPHDMESSLNVESQSSVVGQVDISSQLTSQGLDIEWQRSAYISIKKNNHEQFRLTRSALVQQL